MMMTRKRKLQDISGAPLLRLEDMHVSKRRHMNSKLHQITFLAQFIGDQPPRNVVPKSNASFKEFKRSKASKFLLRK
jgi:hypothetical protein